MRGCNHAHERLQPYVHCRGCNPNVPKLRSYARQVSGFALPFTQPGPKDRDRWEPRRRAGAAAATLTHRLQPDGAQAATLYKLGCNPMAPRWNAPALTVSILAHFDVVGLTEMLDESLLLLADKAGLQHLGYSTLAANNKPEHPAKAKALLKVRVRVRFRVRVP